MASVVVYTPYILQHTSFIYEKFSYNASYIFIFQDEITMKEPMRMYVYIYLHKYLCTQHHVNHNIMKSLLTAGKQTNKQTITV